MEIKKVICEFCNPRCRHLLYTENGRLVKLEPDPADPRSKQVFPPVKACPRFRGAKEFMYHPDRLRFPLKRASGRGDGKWIQISWEQAFDEIAEKLSNLKTKYGAETLALHKGTYRTTEWVYARFMHLFGSPNYISPANVCHVPCINLGAALFGWPPVHRTFLRLERDDKGRLITGCVMIIGMDPANSRPHIWHSIREAKKLGVKLIVIDPRRTETTDLADIWLQLRPGTDTALLMAMINVILNEGLYDRDFVEKWCYGLEALRERAEEYSPEKVESITFVPADRIKEAARLYAQNRPCVTINSMGLEQQSNAISGIHAKFILSMLTGSIDVPGGEYIPGPPECVTDGEMECSDRLSEVQKKKQIGTDRFRFIGWPGRDLILAYSVKTWKRPFSVAGVSAAAHAPSVYRAIISGEPYPVRAMIGMASNPIITHANSKLVYKALKSLDLYVVMDYWLTPSAELADYVLPVASWLERPFLSTGMGTLDTIIAGEQGLPSRIPGEYDRKTDYEIFRGIAIRLGQKDDWPWENLEQVYNYMLGPLGVTHKKFVHEGGLYSPPRKYRKFEKMGFATPSGKAEIYSNILKELGYDPLPFYQEPHESPVSKPDLAKQYPLILSTGHRIKVYFHSEQRQIDSIRRKYPHPIVEIHPDKARELGIEDGDWVWVESPRGRIRMKARLCPGLLPDMVQCDHGWWFPELPGEEPWLHGAFESNVNVLTDDTPEVCDPAGGGWPLKWGLCRVYKCKVY